MLVSLGLQMLLPLILMPVQFWLYFCRHTLQMMYTVPNGGKVSVLSTICCQGKIGACQLLARDVPKWHTMCPRFLCRPGACAIGDWICLSSVPEVVSRTGSTRCSVVASL